MRRRGTPPFFLPPASTVGCFSLMQFTFINQNAHFMKLIHRVLLILAAVSVVCSTAGATSLRVATLHPLLGDLARQVGGEGVEVIDLMKPGADVHHFEPAPRDLLRLKGLKIVFACGKGLESYLDNVRDTLGAGVEVVEVGKNIPSMTLAPGLEIFQCCPEHTAGSIDPHWWHSPDRMRRAVGIIADALAHADPAQAEIYQKNSAAAQHKIVALKTWAKQQIAQIPKADRKLVTAHASFSYFCAEFGFQYVPVLGFAREGEAAPQTILNAIKLVREKGIKAVFPEDQANPKMLTELTRSTGVKIAQKELIADGTAPGAGATFEGMLRHNVGVIVEALKPDPAAQ
jgi:zinc/manganese transport system substrate-binding protein